MPPNNNPNLYNVLDVIFVDFIPIGCFTSIGFVSIDSISPLVNENNYFNINIWGLSVIEK